MEQVLLEVLVAAAIVEVVALLLIRRFVVTR